MYLEPLAVVLYDDGRTYLRRLDMARSASFTWSAAPAGTAGGCEIVAKPSAFDGTAWRTFWARTRAAWTRQTGSLFLKAVKRDGLRAPPAGSYPWSDPRVLWSELPAPRAALREESRCRIRVD